MATIPTFVKQPSENKDYDFDFTNALPSGDNVVSAAIQISEAGLTEGTQAISGQVVKQWFSGGTNGTIYKISCIATTGQGRIVELDFNLDVKDL